MKNNKSLSNALGIDDEIVDVEEFEDVTVEVEQPLALPAPDSGNAVVVIQSDEREDYEETRKTLKELVRKATEAVEGALFVADDEGTPRAYEVVSTTIKTASEVAESLYGLHKKVKETLDEPIQSNSIQIDKAVFVGSPADMLKKVKGNEVEPQQQQQR